MSKKIEIEIYADESKNIKYNNENITYIMVMAIPVEKKIEIYNKLNNSRCLANNNNDFLNCKNNCKYHRHNNAEIHYNCIGNDNVLKKIAINWINVLLENNKKDDDFIHFAIMGIYENRLDLKKFGDYGVFSNIYNLFFRIAVKRLLATYNGYDFIEVKNIFHDNTNEMEQHKFFKKYTISKILEEESLNTNNNKFSFKSEFINFIDSDHKKSTFIIESQFIQFVDLILGLTTNFIHNSATNSNKIELTEKIAPLISRILENPNNKNSHFHYFNKQVISFFPKENHDSIIKKYGNIDENSINDLISSQDNFENTKEALFNKELNQLNIFDMMNL